MLLTKQLIDVNRAISSAMARMADAVPFFWNNTLNVNVCIFVSDHFFSVQGQLR